MVEQAADLYRRVTTPRAAPTVREDASRALDSTLGNIARHEKTLHAAEQSWALLTRVPNGDLTGLSFVLALQAQTYAALARWDDSERALDPMSLCWTNDAPN